jgi:hypothetical protein
MKLAILGSSPLALEAALRFHLHGASLTWFNAAEEEFEFNLETHLDSHAFVSHEGMQLLKSIGGNYAPATFQFSEWKSKYYAPLAALLAAEQKVRTHEVISMSKRYVAPSEQIEGKSRFYDLFRLIFQVNPEEFIKEQEASNPETYERLTEEFKTSLQSNIEMYEDFDVVIDLRRSTQSTSLAVTGRALGESRVSKDQLLYSWSAFKEAKKINQDPLDVRELAIVGSGELAALMTVSLKDWLKDPRSRLFVVSTEAMPFASVLNSAPMTLKSEMQSLFTYMEDEFQKDVNEFHHKLREWQELDDFIQAKKPKPVEPIPRLVYFSGHNATAVDQLIDKRRLFLTLEKPDFRQGLKQPENNALDLKTIGVDRILVATRMQKSVIENYLEHNEKGFFSGELSQLGEWNRDLEVIKGFEDEIFKLFSPAGTH